MATLTKTRARKPLAEDDLYWSHHKIYRDQIFRLSILDGNIRQFNMNITVNEAVQFASYVAQRMTREPLDLGTFSRMKTNAQALRDLADMIERGE